jgi:hypothetical protein
MAKMSYEEALEEVYRRISELSDEEFLSKLDEHRDGYFAKILEETNAFDAWEFERECFDSTPDDIILEPVSFGLSSPSSIFISSKFSLTLNTGGWTYDMNRALNFTFYKSEDNDYEEAPWAKAA